MMPASSAVVRPAAFTSPASGSESDPEALTMNTSLSAVHSNTVSREARHS